MASAPSAKHAKNARQVPAGGRRGVVPPGHQTPWNVADVCRDGISTLGQAREEREASTGGGSKGGRPPWASSGGGSKGGRPPWASSGGGSKGGRPPWASSGGGSKGGRPPWASSGGGSKGGHADPPPHRCRHRHRRLEPRPRRSPGCCLACARLPACCCPITGCPVIVTGSTTGVHQLCSGSPVLLVRYPMTRWGGFEFPVDVELLGNLSPGRVACT